MSTIFTKIIKGEIPCHKVLEDQNYMAFLDIRPINPGHTLVIPKVEIDYIFDLEDDLLGGMMVFAKKVAAALKKAVHGDRIGVMVAGLEVPHAHIHLIPFKTIPELNFSRAKQADHKDLAEMAKFISSHL